jgi:hypothetical protein
LGGVYFIRNKKEIKRFKRKGERERAPQISICKKYFDRKPYSQQSIPKWNNIEEYLKGQPQ